MKLMLVDAYSKGDHILCAKDNNVSNNISNGISMIENIFILTDTCIYLPFLF